jgi:hypothetical protein
MQRMSEAIPPRSKFRKVAQNLTLKSASAKRMMPNMKKPPTPEYPPSEYARWAAASAKNPQPPGAPPRPRETELPPWIPKGSKLASLAPALRDAIPRVIAPAYRQFVLEAANEVERSTGNTLVYLIWLELCGQVQLATTVAESIDLDLVLQDPVLQSDRDDLIERYIRLTTLKGRTTELLMKLRVFNRAFSNPAPTTIPNLPLDAASSVPSPIPNLPNDPENGKSQSC